MQLRKRDKNKKIFEVFVTKEKTIIWNIDFSEEIEITKPPETIFESLELHQNKLEDKIKHKYSVSQSKNSRSIRKIAKKLIKVKKYKLGEVANQVL